MWEFRSQGSRPRELYILSVALLHRSSLNAYENRLGWLTQETTSNLQVSCGRILVIFGKSSNVAWIFFFFLTERKPSYIGGRAANTTDLKTHREIDGGWGREIGTVPLSLRKGQEIGLSQELDILYTGGWTIVCLNVEHEDTWVQHLLKAETGSGQQSTFLGLTSTKTTASAIWSQKGARTWKKSMR